MRFIKLILDFIIKLLSATWNKNRKIEFENKQHEQMNDAEKRIRDAVDGVKDGLDPDVRHGKVDGRNDNDIFDNNNWSNKQ